MTAKQTLSRAFLALACLTLLFASSGAAQQGPPAPPAPPQPPPRQDMRGGAGRDSGREMDHAMDHSMDHGSAIVPPGTWWRNPTTITDLTLTADQQKKLDDILLQSRIELVRMKATLEEEQLKLEPMLNANPPDQAKTLAQISRIADQRAGLEKSNAKMLLALRGVLTADQWTKLQAEQHSHRGGPMGGGSGGQHGQKGPGGQAGQPGPGGPHGPEDSIQN